MPCLLRNRVIYARVRRRGCPRRTRVSQARFPRGKPRRLILSGPRQMVTGVFVTFPRAENVAPERPLVFHRARDHQIYMRPDLVQRAIGDRRSGGTRRAGRGRGSGGEGVARTMRRDASDVYDHGDRYFIPPPIRARARDKTNRFSSVRRDSSSPSRSPLSLSLSLSPSALSSSFRRSHGLGAVHRFTVR